MNIARYPRLSLRRPTGVHVLGRLMLAALSGVGCVACSAAQATRAHAASPTVTESTHAPLDSRRARLVVRVENSDQTPWLWKQPAADFSERTHSGWPRETRVLVAPVREDVPIDVLDFPSDRRVQALPATEGERVFEVLAGHSYIVGLLGGTQAWTPREIAVPANAEQIDVVINSREVGRGTVLLETVDEHGGRRGDALMVRVEDPVHGLLLASLERSASEPWPLRFELPEGEFRIAVEGCANFDNFHGDLIRPRTLGRCDAVVRVTVDGEATLREAISVGARVRLQVEGAMRAEDLAGTLRSFGVLTTSSFEYWAERASIMLRADERWPQAVMFRSPGEYGEYLYSHVKLGTTQTSEVLPAGHFRLEARLRGGRVVTQDVLLVDGQTTDVMVRFD